MSFAAQTKKELTTVANDPCCMRAELQALVTFNGKVHTLDGRRVLDVETENVSTARRIYTQLRAVTELHPEVLVRKKMRLKKNNVYAVRMVYNVDGAMERIGVAAADDGRLRPADGAPVQNCCERAFLRGAFLATGSVNDPGSNSYHLELTVHELEQAERIQRLTAVYDLHPRVIRRKNGYVVYLKEGEKIVEFLSVIGAHQALLRFEDVRILKGMRNQVNRLVNCETANMNKTISAAVRQLEVISLIDERMGLDQLPDHLREVADLRRRFPEANLQELCERLGNRVTKSGLNHRFRKLEQIADHLRQGRSVGAHG
ncbi:MAG: DNA-binding protein WhiA [Alicyclobacillus sp.]|nr:DNA-binding protein WhiA [Alicyclobacillus sp.]